MATVTLTIPDETKKELIRFNWVVWSVVAKQELLKKKIFEKYLKTGELSNEDWRFCERIDRQIRKRRRFINFETKDSERQFQNGKNKNFVFKKQ